MSVYSFENKKSVPLRVLSFHFAVGKINYPISSRLEQQIKNSDRALFILHDQLNLAVFPKELLDRKPILIFVESLAYATSIPHHKQKLVYILSAQRHFAINCYQKSFLIVNLFTEGTYADALEEFLTSYPNIELIYMQPSEWNTRSQMAKLANTFGKRIQVLPNSYYAEV